VFDEGDDDADDVDVGVYMTILLLLRPACAVLGPSRP